MLMIGLNFGIGLWNLLTAGQLVFALKMKLDPSYLATGIDPGVVVGLQALPLWFVAFVFVTSLIKAPLLFVSAWGYFNGKRVSGRYCGNAYATVSLVESAVPVVALGHGLTGGSIIGILYAFFTLLAVNGPFKPMLVR
jgi:hypothetical protein